jgi:hypothetical protein
MLLTNICGQSPALFHLINVSEICGLLSLMHKEKFMLPTNICGKLQQEIGKNKEVC